MATGTATARPVPPPPPPTEQSVSNQRYIEQQLRRTSMHVKIVDLFGGLMMLAAGCLLFLLTVAVVDAWVFELGSVGRVLALMVLTGLVVTYLVVYVAPLFYRRINPEYAARMIEDAEPTLKNSLINFLTFRSNHTAAQEVVQQALEHRAAADLAHVPVESAVDRSKIIRVGYVLVAIMLVCGLYKILSPKDPFQTFARIAAPFSQLSRPARVQIGAVKPGNVEIFRGAVVEVSATIDGLATDESVQLLYSTEDGQTIDAAVDMTPVGSSSRDFECTLKVSDDGIQQTLDYQVIAGDASSEFYRVTVLAAPTIVVEGIEYDYPDYTKRPNHAVARQGDLRALEGTRVKVKCRANHKIKVAWLELTPSSTATGKKPSRAKSIAMDSKDFDATGEILLELLPDGRTPKYENYRVRFKTTDNHENARPSRHQIEVIPDLAPEVQILKPTTDVIEVPEDGKTSLDVRAIDPDYGLSKIDLVSDDIPTQNLFNDLVGRKGQVIVSYDFVPRTLGLSAGDTVVYFAQASDNKTSAAGAATPNVKRTEIDYVIKVTAPEKRDATTSSDASSADDASDDPATDPESGKTDVDPSGKPSDGSRSDPSTDSDGSDSGKPSDSEKPMSGGDKTAGSTSDPGEGGEGASSSDGGNSKSGGESTSGSGGGKTGEGGESTTGSSAKSGDSGSRDSGDGSKSGGGKSSNGGTTGRERSTSDEPLHDGEKFERILDHIKKKQSGDSDDGKSAGGNKNDDGSESGSETSGNKSSDGDSAGDSSDTRKPDSPEGKLSEGTNKDNSKSGTTGDKKNGADPSSQSGNNTGGQGRQPSDSASGSGQDKSGGSDSGGNKDGQKNGGTDASDTGQPSRSQPDDGQNPSGGGKPKSGGEQSGNMNSGQSGGGEKPSDMGGQKNGGQESGGQKSGGQKNGGQESGGQEKSPKSGSKSGGGQQKSGGQKNGGQKKDGKSDGGGQDSKGQGGTPKPQDSQKSGGGPQKPGSKPQGNDSKSPGTGKNSSGNKGQNDGDKSGAGGKGGGQNSGKSGNDSGGGTKPSDQGEGTSNEQGSGEKSGQPGSSQKAGDKTGATGSESGAGSSSKSSSGGQPNSKPGGDKTGSKSGSPFGGGGTGDGDLPDAADSEVADGDKANLEYARKATDLALDYLKDQKSNPDRELLDDLKMTEDELRDFTERYDRLMRNAKSSGIEGKRELDDKLRSLGLRPGRDKRRSRTTPDDLFKDHADGGQSSRPPAKYADDFNAANKGINRTGNK